MSTSYKLVDPFIPAHQVNQKRTSRKSRPQYGIRWIGRLKDPPQTALANRQAKLIEMDNQINTAQCQPVTPLPSHSLPNKSVNQLPNIDIKSTKAKETCRTNLTTHKPPVHSKSEEKHRLSIGKRLWKFMRYLVLPLVTIAAISVGLLAQSLALGSIVVGIFAIVAFLKHIPSRTSFLLSLVMLITVVMLYIINPDYSAAPNYAFYCFIFVIVGILTMDNGRIKYRI